MSSPSPSAPPGIIDLGSEDWSWHGNALISASFESGGTEAVPYLDVGIWVPSMSAPKQCQLEVWQDGEVWPDYQEFSDTDRSVFSVGATSSIDPIVVVTYEATIAASGLTEQVTIPCAQVVNPRSCALGPRIELGERRRGDGSIGDVAPLIVGHSDGVFAVEINKEGDLVGLNASSGSIAWRNDSPGYTSSAQEFAPGYLQTYLKSADVNIVNASRILRVVDGSVFFDVPKGEGHNTGAIVLQEDLLLVSQAGGGGIEQLSVEGVRRNPEFRYWLTPSFLEGRPVFVGIFAGGDAASERDDYLGYLTSDGALAEVLPYSKFEALGAEVHSISNGVIYLTTTAEFVAVDLEGRQVGLPRSDVPEYRSVADHLVGDHVWTLWSGCSETGMCVTRDGLLPG